MFQRAAERANAVTWRQIRRLLDPTKAVRYTVEDRAIVPTNKIGPVARDGLKSSIFERTKPSQTLP